MPQISKQGYGCGSQLSSSQVAYTDDVRRLHNDGVRLVFVRTLQVVGWISINAISPRRGLDCASFAEDRHPTMDSGGAKGGSFGNNATKQTIWRVKYNELPNSVPVISLRYALFDDID